MALGRSAFVLVFVPLVSLVASLPNVHRSQATILVQSQKIPEDLVRSTVTSAGEVRLQTISQEVLSRGSLERLIGELDLYQDLRRQATLERVIEQMRTDVNIDMVSGPDQEAASGRDRVAVSGLGQEAVDGRDQEAVGGPDQETVSGRRKERVLIAFTISYQGVDPQKVALVANRLAGLYVEKNLMLRGEQASETASFLRNVLEELERKLREQEKELVPLETQRNGAMREQNEARRRWLSREYETMKEMYKSVAARGMEATLAERMEQGQKGEQFRVIEPAFPSEAPVEPDRPRLYAVALALALAAAALAILVRERLGRSVA